MSPRQDGNRTDRAIDSHCHQIRTADAGRGGNSLACQFSSSDIPQKLGTKSRQITFHPHHPPPLCLGITGSIAPGGHRENPQQEKPWSPQGHCSPSTPSHVGPVAGDAHPLSPGSPGVLSPVPDHTTTSTDHSKDCEAQTTAMPLEASPLASVINLSLGRGSRAANMLLSALGASLSTHWVMPN